MKNRRINCFVFSFTYIKSSCSGYFDFFFFDENAVFFIREIDWEWEHFQGNN